jgi:hypothetical protein
VLSRLLQREFEAHRVFGESGSLLGLHTVAAEEEEITKALRDRADIDRLIPETPQKPFDLMTILAGGTGLEPVAERRPPSLFASEHAFVMEALAAAFVDAKELDIGRDEADPTFIAIRPPADLVRRLGALPQSYLSEQKVVERLKLTADKHIAELQLFAAIQSSDSQWPEVGYLSPLHPIVDWLVDKVLVAVGRNEAPILSADVSHPTFCIQGMWSNGAGRPQLVEWLAISSDGKLGHRVDDLFDVLRAAGVKPAMPNPNHSIDVSSLQASLSSAVAIARNELGARRAERDAYVDELLTAPRTRLARWIDRSRQLAFEFEGQRRTKREQYVDEIEGATERMIQSLRTTGEPMLRVLAVLVPTGA